MSDEKRVFRVAAGAEGTYPTVGAALAAACEEVADASVPVEIRIAPGEYRERVEIRRPNVTLVGETAESVRIVYGLGAFMDSGDGSGVDGKLGTFRTYTMLVDAHDVTLRNLTIENDAGDGREVGQGLALYADGDRLVVDCCRLLGHQDTLFCGPLPPREVKPGGFIGPKQFAPRVVGRQYFHRCLIAGDVDFIFGGGRAYFEGCEIRSLNRDMDVNGYVSAASTPEGEPCGLVFHGCSFTAEDGVANSSVYLGRPWRDFAQTVLLDCWLGAHIKAEGWWDWNKPAAHKGSYYAAGTLHGPVGSAAAWPEWTHAVDKGAASRFSRRAVLAGNDDWDPESGEGEAVETARLSSNGRTLHIQEFFEDEAALRARFIRDGRQAAFTGGSAADWLAWRDCSRERLAKLVGISLLERCDPAPRVLEQALLAGGITRTKIAILVEPGVWMPFYLLEPARPRRGTDGRALCWICPHGHQGAGKDTIAGVTGVPAADDAIRRFNYDYGLRLARMGYVTVCPDARGWGERRDWKGQGDEEQLYLRGTCANQAKMAEPLGLSVAGLNTWDLMRLVDYLDERGDLCMDELGCFGFSGGGEQTLYLAALDPRVKKAFISGYLYGYADALLHLNGNCACNYAPGLWRLFDMGDIASLVAPRPLLVQSCDGDHLNGPRGLANVDEQLDVVRAAYGLLGCKDNLAHEVCPGGHHLGTLNLEEDVAWLDEQARRDCE